MNLPRRSKRGASTWLLILIALAALSEIASAFQPGDPPYSVNRTHRRQPFTPGPSAPPA